MGARIHYAKVMMWYDRPLPISIPDLCKEYREAAHPNKQIDIFADMFETKPSRIAWILNRAGCDVSPKKMPRIQRNSESIDYVALWEESEDARICDEYRERRIMEENEIMNEVPATNAAEMQQKPAAKPKTKPAAYFASVYMDTVDGFWTTYLSVRYGVALTHDDIVNLVELSDIARAAAGGAE